MDLQHCGWYATVENMLNGGTHNARIVENTVAAYPVGVGDCYWSMPFLLYLFGGDVVRTVEYSVPAFVGGSPCRAHADGSLGFDWSISDITLRVSQSSQLDDRQNR